MAVSGPTTFYTTAMSNDHDYVASCSKEHVQSHHGTPTPVEIPGITFYDLLKEIGVSKVDTLYIDIEGNDILPIRAIIDHNLNITSIIYESTHTDNSIVSELIQEKYTLKKVDAHNNILTKI